MWKTNKTRRTAKSTIAAAAMVLSAIGCAPAENPTPANSADSSTTTETQQATLSGNIVYRPRIALPPKSTITVQLQDVSLADTTAIILAKQVIVTDGQQIPIPFKLTYNSEAIDERHSYAVRADIRDPNGKLTWVTDTSHPVITRNAPKSRTDIRLVQVPRSPDAASPANTNTNTSSQAPQGTWNLESITTPDGGIQRPEEGQPFTLQFLEDSRFAGQAHCNRFAGSYSLKDGGNIEFGQVAATLAACLPSSLGERFLPLLHEVNQLKSTDRKLILTISNSQQLIFSKVADDQTSSVPDQRAPMIPQRTAQNYEFFCATQHSGNFTFKTRTGPGELAVWLPERFGNQYLVLGQVRAASGARYEGDGVTVWNKGSEAMLVVGDDAFMGCQLQT